MAALSSLLLIGLAAVLVERGDLPLATGAALLPFAAVAVALHLRAYRPRTPKAVGWALVVANLTAVALLGTALLQSG